MTYINMKLYISKYFILITLFASYHTAVCSQDSKYEERIVKYHSAWNNLIPSYLKTQYAGSMGLISVGTGWDYGKNNQWETDVMLGWVPKYETDHDKVCFTLKQNFIPWSINPGNKDWIIEPFACGLYFNTVFGEEFWGKEPSRYPNKYYNFSTKLRTNIYIGQRITYKIPTHKRNFGKALTFFYEISTNELYIVSAVDNDYLKPTDYLHLSLGLKLQLF